VNAVRSIVRVRVGAATIECPPLLAAVAVRLLILLPGR
jgi:hypothetical protein